MWRLRDIHDLRDAGIDVMQAAEDGSADGFAVRVLRPARLYYYPDTLKPQVLYCFCFPKTGALHAMNAMGVQWDAKNAMKTGFLLAFGAEYRPL
ncbi:MAG: hypothetical protein GX800_04480 [Clostridiaceae bacterium]|nr:hypothetical protein [Clostridiaceae bacterium]